MLLVTLLDLRLFLLLAETLLGPFAWECAVGTAHPRPGVLAECVTPSGHWCIWDQPDLSITHFSSFLNILSASLAADSPWWSVGAELHDPTPRARFHPTAPPAEQLQIQGASRPLVSGSHLLVGPAQVDRWCSAVSTEGRYGFSFGQDHIWS